MIKNLSIRSKFLILFIGIVIFASIDSMITIRDLNRVETISNEIVVANNFVTAIHDLVIFDDRLSITAFVALRLKDPLLQSAYTLRSEQYKIFAQNHKNTVYGSDNNIEQLLIIRARLSELENEALKLQSVGNVTEAQKILDGGNYTHYKSALSALADTGRAQTIAHVAMLAQERTRVTDESKWHSQLMLLLLAVIGGSIVYTWATNVSHTFKEIEQSATAMSRGEQGRRVKVRGHDEVARAAIAFNKIAVAIEKDQMEHRLKDISKMVDE